MGSRDVNITKMLQKMPAGDIQSASYRGNMLCNDRIITTDDSNCISDSSSRFAYFSYVF